MKKGFSLIEIIVSLGISFLVLLVIYKAYFLSTSFFSMGIDTIQEQAYLRKIFSTLDEDLRYLNRFNSISTEMDSVEFEIFNVQVLDEDKNTNDKKVEGKYITFSTRSAKDVKRGLEYQIITKATDVYDWWMKFGHSQTLNDDGYPEDMLEPVTGKSITQKIDAADLIDQDVNIPFLINSIKYVPYDAEGLIIEAGGEYNYSVLKNARSIRVEIEYTMKSEYGDATGDITRKKTASTNIPFIGLAEDK